MAKFTRNQYMKQECSHDVYYAQFVTPSIIRMVEQRFGERLLRASHREFFNDIPLQEWDAMADWTIQMMDRAAWRELECTQCERGLHWSMNSNICILKEAARQIRTAALEVTA